MNPKNHYAVILASGAGVKLWPMSTSKRPKQFLDLLGIGKTFVQITHNRLKKVVPEENILFITTEEYAPILKEQIPSITSEQIILEPRVMNTAACNLLAAMHVQEINPDAKLIIAPSDHLIYDAEDFVKAVNIAFKHAENDYLITLGTSAKRPDTTLSYVQIIEEGLAIKKVKTFVDKPDEVFAESFIESGDFLWNTGILIWSAKAIIEEFKQHKPLMVEILKQYFDLPNRTLENLKPIYSTLDVISINLAILEKSKNVYVIPTEMGWNDMGTWKAIHDHTPVDSNGNHIKSRNYKSYNTLNTFIHSTEDKAIVVDGLSDFVVIDTRNALLIAPKHKIKDIRSYVNDLKLNKGEKYC